MHGDIGPEHVLGRDGVLTGVIDFGDLHVGDAAIALAWALHSMLYGNDIGGPRVRADGLNGVRDRLRDGVSPR